MSNDTQNQFPVVFDGTNGELTFFNNANFVFNDGDGLILDSKDNDPYFLEFCQVIAKHHKSKQWLVDSFCDVQEAFNTAECFDKNKKKVFVHIACNYLGYKDLQEIVDFVENDACIFEGSSSDYAYEFLQDCYNIDKMMGGLAGYFDYDKFGRDLELGGDIEEVCHRLYLTNPHDI